MNTSLGALTLRHARVFLLGALLLAIAGVSSWLTMPRQEDPEIAVRGGMVIIPFPGADALTIERLVAKPAEDALERVQGIDYVKTTVRDDVVIMNIILLDQISDVDPIWSDVEDRLEIARRDFPTGVGPIQTNWDLFDLESVLVGVTGSDDRLALAAAADLLRDRLLRVDGVSRVEITADPQEQITITLDDARARSLGVSAEQIARIVESRSGIIPAGSLRVDGLKVAIDPRSDFDSLAELAATAIPLPDGSSVTLSDVAAVRYEAAQPISSLARLDGQPAVVVGAVPQESIDVVAWGARVQAAIDEVEPAIAPLRVEMIAFQPDRVERRLNDLGTSLVQGVAIVALILCLTMGLRMGLAISLIVPLVALAALVVFSASGGLLQQFSIAGLVVSLGLLVDNAIVVGERIQDLIDAGTERVAAAQQAVSELTWPLAAATGTTVASFLPLLLARGPVGEFTRGIPWLVTVTLLISLVFALTVTPLIAIALLRPRPDARRADRLGARIAAAVSRVPVRSPILVLLAVSLAMAAVIPLAPRVKREFFPLADRDQLLIELELAEGSHLEQTDAQIARIERALIGRPGVAQVAAFVGSSTPRFYYNLPLRPQSPQLAQILVTLDDASLRWETVEWARGFAREEYPGTSFLARILEQGPPTAAPIEVRVFADDFASLAQATDQISAIVAAAPAARDVRHDLPQGRPILVLDPHDAAAAAMHTSRAGIARALLGRTRGLPAGQLRSGDAPVPLLVRTGAGERSGASLEMLEVGPALPLASVASTRAEVRPAAIYRRGGQRVVSVLAELEPGRGFNEVLTVIVPQLKELKLPPGARYEVGGAAEGSGKANKAIAAAAPAGVALLLLCLLLQFASIRRTLVILLTIPLSAIGVIPGLYFWNQPFGFQSLLGVLSLAGIVVNNAIILMDVLDTYRAQGMGLDEALERSVQDRLRPILLTTATTVLGLTPLLWSSSALWPPMASAMITGLLASTLLTLLVVPAVCKLIFSLNAERARDVMVRVISGGAATAVLLLSVGLAQAAEPITLEQAITRAADSSALARAVEAPVAAEQAAERAAWRAAWLPVVQVRGELVGRSDELAITTPVGAFVQQRQWGGQGVLAVAQPLLNLERQQAGVDGAQAGVEARRASSVWQRKNLGYQAAALYLAQRSVAANIDALDRALESLVQQQARIDALLASGRGVETDRLRVAAALEELAQSRLALTAQQAGLEAQLGRLVGAPGPVSAAPLDWSAYPTALPADPSVERADRRALGASLEQIAARQRALNLQLVPTLEVQGRVIHQLNTPLTPQTWGELGLVLVWTPFVAGTRAAQDDALEAQAVAIRAQRDDLDAQRAAELVRIRAAWEASAAEVATMARVIVQREQIVAQIRAQYDAGRAIITDVLEAEAALASSRARHEAARAQRLLRQLEYALVW